MTGKPKDAKDRCANVHFDCVWCVCVFRISVINLHLNVGAMFWLWPQSAIILVLSMFYDWRAQCAFYEIIFIHFKLNINFITEMSSARKPCGFRSHYSDVQKV